MFNILNKICRHKLTNFTEYFAEYQPKYIHLKSKNRRGEVTNEREDNTFTSMILFLIRDCRNTHTSLTSLLCMYFSLICSHVVMQFDMYRCINSEGRSTTLKTITPCVCVRVRVCFYMCMYVYNYVSMIKCIYSDSFIKYPYCVKPDHTMA